MTANVHESNNNDILSNNYPDRCINHGTTNCHYFNSNEFNTKFNKTDRFSIFQFFFFYIIVLTEQCKCLQTDNLQFGFKQHSSTVICTALLIETIEYYIEHGSDCYLLLFIVV